MIIYFTPIDKRNIKEVERGRKEYIIDWEILRAF